MNQKPPVSALKNNDQSGFSLIESVIAVVIASVVIALGVASLKVYFYKKSFDKTQDHKALIVEALGNYLQEYGALPCPAPMRASSPTPWDHPDFGRKVDCTAAAAPTKTFRTPGRAGKMIHIGAVPARDLGLPLSAMVDSWGNLFTYAVTEEMTVPGTFSLPEPTGSVHLPLPVDSDGNNFFIVEPLAESGLSDNYYHDFFDHWEQGPKKTIRNGSDLILAVTNGGNTEVLTLVNYFNQDPLPNLIKEVPDISDCTNSIQEGDNCISVYEIQNAPLFDYGNLVYQAAAIDVLQNNATLSPPNPVSLSVVTPGHIPFALISHGPSGAGAHTIQGTLFAPCSNASADGQNCDYDSALGSTGGVPDKAVFVSQTGYDMNPASAEFFDDTVSYALQTSRTWPPHQWCDPGTGAVTGLQFQNPDLSWGTCADLKGEIGLMGQPGDTGHRGPTGPSGDDLDLSNAECTVATQVMQGINPGTILICAENEGAAPVPPKTLDTETVKVMSPPAGGGYQSATATCPPGMVLVGCGGTRHEMAYDTHSEEDGGYFGTVKLGTDSCKTGIDGDGGGSRAIAFAYCMRLVP